MASSNEVSWSELVASAPEYKPTTVVKKVPVVTWSKCKCSRKHRTADAYFNCAVGKRYRHNGDNAHLDRVYLSGSGVWAVMSEKYSGDDYLKHNNTVNNIGHMKVYIQLHDTYENASKTFLKFKDADKYLIPNIIKVAL